MIRVTKLTDYGVVLMAHAAKCHSDNKFTAAGLSQEILVPLPTVRKILKVLTHKGLLLSHRGVTGGYSLASKASDITLMDIVSALEGPMSLTECSTGEAGGCSRESVCGLRKNWSWVNSLLRNTLEGFTLEQMAASPAVLQKHMQAAEDSQKHLFPELTPEHP